ncbi:serine hydrolase domain-containing protein [Mucilaginibacter terrae]|uniref:serine hydrolase domain-containing protein n=1 Tax=Mucilaginibacter terrae TaxID=1955052 RepID=UPI0036399D98
MKNLNYSGGLALLCLLLTGCYTIRAVRWWEPGLDDVNKFKSVRVTASSQPFAFIDGTGISKNQKLKTYLDTFLNRTNTDAFVVISHDTILYENYPTGNATATHPSFSIAKSFIGTLIGIAVDRRLISSTNKPVIDYFPGLAKNDTRMSKLTIQHLLDMRAGLAFNENKETAFGEITKLYYGRSLKRQVNRIKLKTDPGTKLEYQSISTQLLAAILEKATGKNKSNLFYLRLHSADFEAEGILQQTIYVNPDNGVIIVRLGNYPNKRVNFPDNFIPGLGRQL